MYPYRELQLMQNQSKKQMSIKSFVTKNPNSVDPNETNIQNPIVQQVSTETHIQNPIAQKNSIKNFFSKKSAKNTPVVV